MSSTKREAFEVANSMASHQLLKSLFTSLSPMSKARVWGQWEGSGLTIDGPDHVPNLRSVVVVKVADVCAVQTTKPCGNSLAIVAGFLGVETQEASGPPLLRILGWTAAFARVVVGAASGRIFLPLLEPVTDSELVETFFVVDSIVSASAVGTSNEFFVW